MNELNNKYDSKKFTGTDSEKIQIIKEVIISNQYKLRELKVSFYTKVMNFSV